MIRAKDGDFFVADWLRNRNTLKFIGIWEKVYNPSFNYVEFAIIKSQASLNRFKAGKHIYANEADVLNVAMFGMTAKQWREANADKNGNIRDYATINELKGTPDHTTWIIIIPIRAFGS